MKFSALLSFLLLAAVLLSACGPTTSQPVLENQSGLKVLAVETFLAEIARNVAGERTPVESLIPLGLDPHAFEPAPQDVTKIAESDVLIVNGAGFETWLTETLDNAGGQRRVIEASAGLISRVAREGESAVMSDADLNDVICAQMKSAQAQSVEAGGALVSAARLPAESGLFSLKLAKQADGSYAGFIQYVTDESGDFQMATAAGTLQVQKAGDGSGLGFEKTLSLGCAPLSQGNIIQLEKNGQYILALTGFSNEYVSLLIGPAGGLHQHEGDPHFWLDPTLVVKYVENIRDGLIAADPAGKDVYTRNAAAYIVKLTDLDGWIKAEVAQIPAERRVIVTNHESFGYFADRYGFTIIGTIVPSVTTGASPSAQQLARLVDRIKLTGALAIFLETGASSQLADQVSAETGVKVVTGLYSHSITKAGGEAPTYLEMMKYNVNAIVGALK
ncbi:MAG: metal ABC transporter substrate-binding protein [Chloroflexi bacterium]|nr:metal ABC transporter substrate-binding protein [Chloroflexota bacterium]